MGFAALAVVLGAAACDAGGDSERSETATSEKPASTVEPVEVGSSLEGMSTLPQHVRWVATTSLPAQEVKEVRFLAGPYRVWTDFEPPYTYGPEGAWLVPAVIDHGAERPSGVRFEVRVVARDGRSWRKVTLARVPKLQVPPSAWFEPVVYVRLPPAMVRNPVEVEHVDEFASTATSWAYFSAGQVSVGRTSETAYTYEYSVEGRRLHVGAPIFYGSLDRPGKRIGGWRARGSQCALNGPPATYAWSMRRGAPFTDVDGNRRFTEWFVLRARNEPCEPRRRVLEGVWAFLGP
jgi:hypothetical protein